MINASGRIAFGLNDQAAAGQPISKLINDPATIDFITQEETEQLQMKTELSCQDGRTYAAELTLIEGGIRSVLMHEIG